MFYGFELYGSRSTTAGHPNPRTGRFNIAGHIQGFNTRKERDLWADSHKKLACTRKELRQFCLGLSIKGFEETLRVIAYIH